MWAGHKAWMGLIIMHTLFFRETLKETILKAYAGTNSAVSQHNIEKCYCEDADIREVRIYEMQGIFWLT
jgi:hypothetical protein